MGFVFGCSEYVLSESLQRVTTEVFRYIIFTMREPNGKEYLTVERLRIQQKTKVLLIIANVTGQFIAYAHRSNITKTGATNTSILKTN